MTLDWYWHFVEEAWDVAVVVLVLLVALVVYLQDREATKRRKERLRRDLQDALKRLPLYLRRAGESGNNGDGKQ